VLFYLADYYSFEFLAVEVAGLAGAGPLLKQRAADIVVKSPSLGFLADKSFAAIAASGELALRAG